jgi:hypothetical protein
VNFSTKTGFEDMLLNCMFGLPNRRTPDGFNAIAKRVPGVVKTRDALLLIEQWQLKSCNANENFAPIIAAAQEAAQLFSKGDPFSAIYLDVVKEMDDKNEPTFAAKRALWMKILYDEIRAFGTSLRFLQEELKKEAFARVVCAQGHEWLWDWAVRVVRLGVSPADVLVSNTNIKTEDGLLGGKASGAFKIDFGQPHGVRIFKANELHNETARQFGIITYAVNSIGRVLATKRVEDLIFSKIAQNKPLSLVGDTKLAIAPLNGKRVLGAAVTFFDGFVAVVGNMNTKLAGNIKTVSGDEGSGFGAIKSVVSTLAHIDKNDAETRRQFHNLEALDFICGQGDRNPTNVMISFADEKKPRVVGIDSDFSFPPENKFLKAPLLVDTVFAAAIGAVQASELEVALKGLSMPEIEFATERLAAFKKNEKKKLVADWAKLDWTEFKLTKFEDFVELQTIHAAKPPISKDLTTIHNRKALLIHTGAKFDFTAAPQPVYLIANKSSGDDLKDFMKK